MVEHRRAAAGRLCCRVIIRAARADRVHNRLRRERADLPRDTRPQGLRHRDRPRRPLRRRLGELRVDRGPDSREWRGHQVSDAGRYERGLLSFFGSFQFTETGIVARAGDEFEISVVFLDWVGFQYYATGPGENNPYTHRGVTGQTTHGLRPFLRGHVAI